MSSEKPSRRLGPPWGKEPAQEITLRVAPPAIILRGRPAKLFATVVCTAAWFGLLRYGAGLNHPLALVFAVGATLFFGVMGTGGRLRLSFGVVVAVREGKTERSRPKAPAGADLEPEVRNAIVPPDLGLD